MKEHDLVLEQSSAHLTISPCKVPRGTGGHLHRVAFGGGAAQDLTPDLPPYSPFGLVAVGPYVACYAGIGGGVEALVIRDGDVRRHAIDGMPLGVEIDPTRGWLVLNEAPVGRGMVGTYASSTRPTEASSVGSRAGPLALCLMG